LTVVGETHCSFSSSVLAIATVACRSSCQVHQMAPASPSTPPARDKSYTPLVVVKMGLELLQRFVRALYRAVVTVDWVGPSRHAATMESLPVAVSSGAS